MNYTWSQFIAFIGAIERRTKQRNTELFTLMLIAARGSQDSIDSTLQTLEM